MIQYDDSSIKNRRADFTRMYSYFAIFVSMKENCFHENLLVSYFRLDIKTVSWPAQFINYFVFNAVVCTSQSTICQSCQDEATESREL